MTLYEQITSMSIENMAEFLYEICHEKDIQFIKYLNDNGVSVSLVEIDRDIQIAIQLQSLMSEVGGEKI